MPLKRTTKQKEAGPSREQEQAEGEIQQPVPEPVEQKPGESDRPHQAYVERKLRQYLRDNNIHSLVKPSQQEIRSTAMPILCKALRRRTSGSPLYKAYQGVNAMRLYFTEKGKLKQPFTLSEECPDYVEALIQLADDLGELARQIPSPNHPEPKHPPIFYLTDKVTGRPVPRLDSLLFANYVRNFSGSPLTEIIFFRPWRMTGSDPTEHLWADHGYYTLESTPENDVEIILHWALWTGNEVITMTWPLSDTYFSPTP